VLLQKVGYELGYVVVWILRAPKPYAEEDRTDQQVTGITLQLTQCQIDMAEAAATLSHLHGMMI